MLFAPAWSVSAVIHGYSDGFATPYQHVFVCLIFLLFAFELNLFVNDSINLLVLLEHAQYAPKTLPWKSLLTSSVPLTIAAPAALAASAYLGARTQISEDLVLLGNIITLTLQAKYYDSRDRVNLFYRLEERAQDRRDGQRTFLIYQGRSWTFKDAYDLAIKYGTWLKTEHGIQSKDIVAMDFMNSPKMIFLTLGLWSIGAFPAYINYNLTSQPLLHCIRTSSSRVVFVDDEVKDKFSPEVTEALAGSDFRGGGGSVDIVYLDAALESRIALVKGVREPDSARSGAGIKTGNKTCALIYTSGTTGMPKAAVGSYRICM